MAVIAFMAGNVSTSYGQTRDQKSYSERDNVHQTDRNKSDSKQDYREVQRKSDFEFQEFKKESRTKIRNNERKISALKGKISKLHSRGKAEYQKDLRVLEQKNTRLKKQLANFKNREHDKWMSFKRDFNHDLDEVGEALKDFSVDNKRKERS